MNDFMNGQFDVWAFLGPIGWPELLIILIIALLIFGSRLPQVMRSMGRSVNEFKAGMGDVAEGIDLDEPISKDAVPNDSDGAKTD